MSEATSQILLRAYELIEADKQDEARNLLEPVIESEKDNADAWWLYIHAVDSPEEAQDAIDKLVAVNPNYPGLQELRQKISDTGDLTAMRMSDEGSWSWNIIRVVGVAAVFIIVILGLLLLTQNGEDNFDPTLSPTTDVQSQVVIPTDVEATLEDKGGSQSSVTVEEQFADFVLANPVLLNVDSSQGSAQLINICVVDSPREVLDSAMIKVAELSGELTDVDYIGVRIRDCESDSVLNSIIVERSAASQFMLGEIDQVSYQTLWRTVK